jgi:hypothetical protein
MRKTTSAMQAMEELAKKGVAKPGRDMKACFPRV